VTPLVVLVLGQALFFCRHHTVEETLTGLLPRVEERANYCMSTPGLGKKGREKSLRVRVRD